MNIGGNASLHTQQRNLRYESRAIARNGFTYQRGRGRVRPLNNTAMIRASALCKVKAS